MRYAAKICAVKALSPTIRGITLHFPESALPNFYAGQWADFFIPDLSAVTGFSMCSAPHELLSSGKLDFAVKYSDEPPAKWIHSGKCHIGANVALGFGGDFRYNPEKDDSDSPLTLIAGGVGINPLYSILKETVHHALQVKIARPISLLYSASTCQELQFKEDFVHLREAYRPFSYTLFATREAPPTADEADLVKYRRIGTADLTTSFSNQTKHRTKFYVCGPPSFIDSAVEILTANGILDSAIFFEKWW